MATLHWACQFLGMVVTPLNWRAKEDEVVYCIQDADVRAVFFEPISAEAVVPAAAQCNVPAVAVGDVAADCIRFASLIEEHRGVALVPEAKADDFSLMLYTSGTTG